MAAREDFLILPVYNWFKETKCYSRVETNAGQKKHFALSDPIARRRVVSVAGVWESKKESASHPDVVAWDEVTSTEKPRIAVELKWAEHTSGPLDGLWQACLYLRGFDQVLIGTQISLEHLADNHGHTAVPELLRSFGIGYLYVPMRQALDRWESDGEPIIEIEPPLSNRWRQKTAGPRHNGHQWILEVLGPEHATK